jgi:hypothetical protein
MKRKKSFIKWILDLYGISGLTFAVLDDEVTPQAAMASRC